VLASQAPIPDAGQHVVEVLEQESDPLPPCHRRRFYVRGVSGGNRPRTSRSLLAQTVLVLPRTMVVYDHGIQQQKRVERDDHRDCNGEICPNAHGRPFKDESYYEALALSSPRKFLLSRASTEVGGGESAGEGPRGGDDAAPTRPPAPETWRVSRLPRKRCSETQ
jgi:hypothetical protein